MVYYKDSNKGYILDLISIDQFNKISHLSNHRKIKLSKPMPTTTRVNKLTIFLNLFKIKLNLYQNKQIKI